ncbi:MAG: phosphate/phosphite/phosphonate ABC transporter substrate-binding protein [Desulfuromonadaceae bacterium]
MKKALTTYTALFLLLTLLLPLPPASAAAEKDDDTPQLFRTGFIQNAMMNTDPRDAKAVLEVHGREITRLMGMSLSVKVVLYPEIDSMTAALRRGDLELAAVPSIDYLRIRKTVPLIPSFVGNNSNGTGITYVIITRKDSGIRSFSDLKGKSIMTPTATKYESSQLWLEVLLMKAEKGGVDTFFKQVKESPKLSNAIMGAFFRQADAALVTRTSFTTSCELNPQLTAQLTVLAESPNLSDAVVCLMPGTSEKLRTRIYNAMLQLNETKSGKQIYTIFQTNGITPFKEEYLDGLENLVSEHKRLKAKSTAKK